MRKSICGMTVLLVVSLAGCGGAASEPTESAATPAATSVAASVATVVAAERDLGTVLADAEDATLYLFTNDTGSASTCYDDCEASWPPLTATGAPTAGEGVDETLLDTTEREDGALQVTYNGHPLYYFGGDQAPGDVNGQGVGDVWFAVSPEGEAVDG